MPARTGQQYLDGLRRSKRELWLGNERVDDIVDHPALSGGAKSMARLYDIQHEHPEDCLVPDPETGEPINVSHITPRSKEDVLLRGRGIQRIADATVGMMGRSPDYVNCCFGGFVGQAELWAGPDKSNEEGAHNLVSWQKKARREDLACTHAIINPTNDYSQELLVTGKAAPVHKVSETADSIVVRGAKALGTLAPYADELTVWPAQPLFQEGAGPYALSFAIPMDTPGLIFLCRDSAAATKDSAFDRPLSSRFDEQDAFVIFDDVEIPKERVFLDGHRDIYNSALANGFFPNMQQHTTIRALTKLQFALGLAARIAETVNDSSDHTVDMLGELYCYVELTQNALSLAEEHCREYPGGVVFPDDTPLDVMRVMLPQWMPRAVEIIKLVGRHNLLATPSKAMIDDPRLAGLIDVTLAGAEGKNAVDRVALYRLAWDFVGSFLAGRHDLYERFYIGSARQGKKVLWMNAQGQFAKGYAAIGDGQKARRRAPSRRRADELVGSLLARMAEGSSPA
ncbi:4-hydroxyphenylacetate 3-hydroxylase N-terminal domain-containing protein [Streptomyces sp. NPDC007162]|uniref:4-hydroxyphenylacetate 3-hydroxylase family protein n=1 Tax=Streptomyces sp. NPDC007162 TaxID=3156917 RepID=UPI0033ED52D0